MSSPEKPAGTAFLRPVLRSTHASLAFVCIACVAFDTIAAADGIAKSDNPYKVIFERNLFALRPPATGRIVAPPPAPSSTIVLTGITTVLGEKRAFLEITPPAKPPGPGKQISCILAEREREQGIEVLEIDSNAGSVKVSENGTVTTLTFEKNGRKTPATAVRTLPRFQTLRLPVQAQRR